MGAPSFAARNGLRAVNQGRRQQPSGLPRGLWRGPVLCPLRGRGRPDVQRQLVGRRKPPAAAEATARLPLRAAATAARRQRFHSRQGAQPPLAGHPPVSGLRCRGTLEEGSSTCSNSVRCHKPRIGFVYSSVLFFSTRLCYLWAKRTRCSILSVLCLTAYLV